MTAAMFGTVPRSSAMPARIGCDASGVVWGSSGVRCMARSLRSHVASGNSPAGKCRTRRSRRRVGAMAAVEANVGIGDLLRHWRRVRGKSQLELAGDARTTARYVSFVETGRAQPSRRMVVRLARALDVPLRERNALLLAAGY